MQETLRYLSAVSSALAHADDFYAAIDALCAMSVPLLFDAVHIVTSLADGEAGYSVSRGTVAGPAAYQAHIMNAGEICGYIHIYRERPLDDIDTMIVTDLVTRIESALHTSYILARQRHVADTLQRALLPHILPQKKSVKISAAYRPASDEAAVGGDWYDVFDLPDGRTAFSIGDVAGHGLHAAVIMGEVRQAFRAAALHPKSPSLVLERANTIVNMRRDSAIVTAIFGIFDESMSTITYAVAGHPPPILAPLHGVPQILPASGIPLGVARSVQTCDWTISLAPGAAFVLFTDGLVEHSRNILTGEQELLQVIASQMHLSGGATANDIVDRVFESHTNVDDSAMLVFRAEEQRNDAFEFVFSATPACVAPLRAALRTYAHSMAFGSDLEYALITTVGEAAANAVEHARVETKSLGLVRVHLEIVEQCLLVEVRNNGAWKAADRNEERGRGIPIIRSLSDHLEIQTTQNQTVVRITLRIDS